MSQYFNEGSSGAVVRGLVSAGSIGGAEGDRTPDLVIANDALSRLSYGPNGNKMCAIPCALSSGRVGGPHASVNALVNIWAQGCARPCNISA